ncbi:MAG: hypothetical protein ACUVWK_07080, partial [Nitrososphaerales archaeon]
GSAYTMSSGADEILLFVKITNYSNKDIEFSQTSVLMVDIRELDKPNDPGTAESETYFFILDSTSTSAQPVAYSDYSHKVLGNGGSTILVFGANQIRSDELNNDNILIGTPGDPQNSLSDENLAWVFVVIFWRFSDLSGAAGQTILYNAIHIIPSS